MTGIATQNAPRHAPPARPHGGEQRVGSDDEQPDVGVVHADPRLDEEHPVDQDEDGHEPGHEPSPEQDPREEVQADRHQDTGDDPGQAPGEGMRADVDGRGLPVGAEDQELLAIGGGVVGLDVHRPGGRLQAGGELGVGVDRVRGWLAMGFDDVDGPRATVRRLGPGRQTEHVDLLAGRVEGDPAPETGQGMPADAVRPICRRIATDDHDPRTRHRWRSRS